MEDFDTGEQYRFEALDEDIRKVAPEYNAAIVRDDLLATPRAVREARFEMWETNARIMPRVYWVA